MALISRNYSFLSDSVLYGSKQNHVMNKLPQSVHILACGEAATNISHVRRYTEYHRLLTWENVRKVYAQVIQKEALNTYTIGQKLKCTHQLGGILFFSRALITCI